VGESGGAAGIVRG